MSDLVNWTGIKRQRRWEEVGDHGLVSEAVADSRQALLEFSKDYDRILYSTAFRRLGGVTQVVSASETALFHNRLTHSLKTAQVGARIANVLIGRHAENDKQLAAFTAAGGIESRVVRAACMAHDLGHPPFGHIAETELKNISSWRPNVIVRARSPRREVAVERQPRITSTYHLEDGFEGNAQSFRIVTKLAFREKARSDAEYPALDLTRATLAAMLKYPWARGQKPDRLPDGLEEKWGHYRTETDLVRWVFNGRDRPHARDTGGPFLEYRTLEAQIMDWADDISYAVHDVEDFFRAGIIPLNTLSGSESEWGEFFAYAWEKRLRKLYPDHSIKDFNGPVDSVRKRLPRKPYEGSRADREDLHEFASELIKDAIAKTNFVAEGVIKPEPDTSMQIDILKQLAWYYVIDRPSLESVQRGQRTLIRRLYSSLVEWVEESWRGPTADRDHGRRTELPNRLLEYLDVAFREQIEDDPDHSYGSNQRITRAVIDYIVSLTEPEAIELGARLFGTSAHSMLDTWVRS